MDCLFCNIVNGSIPATIVYQDALTIAFVDIHPQAPQHKIIIPRQHIATLNDLSAADNHLIGHMTEVAVQLAKEAGIAEEGYRLVMNCNRHGGQTVFHLHLHLLGGRHMTWPPG